MNSSKQTSALSTEKFTPRIKFYDYSNIPLKLFIEVAESADYMRLVMEGECSIDECFEQWEKLIQENSRINGNAEYRSYYDNLKHYNKLLADFNVIKATITILYFEIDNEMIEYLNAKGYKISTKSSVDYANSLNAAMNKSNNLITKIEMRYKAIVRASEQSKGSNRQITFEVLMANLTIALGFTVDDSLTLARYNEYNKIIKKKNAESRNHKVRSHGSGV